MQRPNAIPSDEDEIEGIHDTRGGEAPRHHHPRPDDGNAFLPDPLGETGQHVDVKDRGEDDAPTDFGDELAQEMLTAATGNIDMAEQQLDQVSSTEVGGPFVISSEEDELVDDVDPNNPPGATREPFPTAMRGDAVPPPSAR
jgi:hypothetical protein